MVAWMPIRYDPPAAEAVYALLNDARRSAVAERVVNALHALNDNPGEERFRRRSYAPSVDWGFLVRTRDEEVLILWDWDPDHEMVRVRYVGPDLLGL
jgi:hypothetical protein